MSFTGGHTRFSQRASATVPTATEDLYDPVIEVVSLLLPWPPSPCLTSTRGTMPLSSGYNLSVFSGDNFKCRFVHRIESQLQASH